MATSAKPRRLSCQTMLILGFEMSSQINSFSKKTFGGGAWRPDAAKGFGY
jgi:hypothetical protein